MFLFIHLSPIGNGFFELRFCPTQNYSHSKVVERRTTVGPHVLDLEKKIAEQFNRAFLKLLRTHYSAVGSEKLSRPVEKVKSEFRFRPEHIRFGRLDFDRNKVC